MAFLSVEDAAPTTGMEDAPCRENMAAFQKKWKSRMASNPAERITLAGFNKR